MLYVVATPIGNLEDITQRALRILGEVDMVACEDTRQTLKLLTHFGIKAKLTSFHAHSVQREIDKLLAFLEAGKSIALVTDAGTPGISDPGYLLVSACARKQIPVTPIPGASAFLTALMASGVPIQEFTYYGFAPAKKGRQTFFNALADVERTQVFYESKHRITNALAMLQEHIPDRTLVVARELTKTFETFYRGSAAELAERLADTTAQKGEFVIIVAAEGFHFEEKAVVDHHKQRKNKYMDKQKGKDLE